MQQSATRATIEVPTRDLLQEVAGSPRLPAFTLRKMAIEHGAPEGIQPEDIRVSPAVYAMLRDATRVWCHRNGKAEKPDLYPSPRCDASVRNAVAVVEVRDVR
jgi:hypothetical protein